MILQNLHYETQKPFPKLCHVILTYDLRSLYKTHARDWSKIDYVCFCYQTKTSHLSAVLIITHGKRALFISNGYEIL